MRQGAWPPDAAPPATSTPIAAPPHGAPGGARRRPWKADLEASHPWILALVAVCVLSAAQLVRQPGAPSWDTIWAEDGSIFATEALGGTWEASLYKSYAGYVQLVSRALALPLRLLPPSWWAAWLATSSAFVISLLAVFVYRALGSFAPAKSLRALVAATAALSPAMWHEANTNIANLGWPLLFAAFWALLFRSTSRRAIVARSAVLVATALTTTLAVVYLPLALLLAWQRRRSRGELSAFGSFVIAMAAQIALDRSTPTGDLVRSGRDLAEVYFVRVLGSATIGERWLERLWTQVHFRLGIALAIGFAAFFILVGRKVRPSERWVPLLAIGASALLFAVPVWIRGTEAMRLQQAFTLNGSRYVIVPALLLVSAAALAVESTGSRWLRSLLALQMVVVLVTSLGLANPRSEGPRWRKAVAEAQLACSSQAPDAEVGVQATPAADQWKVHTTCGRLR